MPIITDKRKQYIVSTQTLLTYKRLVKREYISFKIIGYGEDKGSLLIDSDGIKEISGKVISMRYNRPGPEVAKSLPVL